MSVVFVSCFGFWRVATLWLHITTGSLCPGPFLTSSSNWVPTSPQTLKKGLLMLSRGQFPLRQSTASCMIKVPHTVIDWAWITRSQSPLAEMLHLKDEIQVSECRTLQFAA
ncbi:hypothetical protein B0O80DRAFT_425529 [Mortierella sp. GBAus27b]|nr:hypothetical protein B0O80DRAFT_425529 [Mortierella sp. GBAus27b]